MKFFKEGDRSKAVCSYCKKIVATTFKVRRASIKDGATTYLVPDVLVGACDECDKTITVPQQSFAAVAEVRNKAAKRSLEVRMPRHLLDVLNNCVTSLGLELTSDLPSILIKLFIADLAAHPRMQKRLRKNLASELLTGSYKKQCRMSIKISESMANEIAAILENCNLSKTDFVEAIVIEIKKGILDDPKGEKAKSVRSALLAVG